MKSINRYILGILNAKQIAATRRFVCEHSKAFRKKSILAAAFLLMLPLAPAYAQCTSPAGVEGEIIFGDDDNVPAYCDNTNWIAMVGGDPQSPGPAFPSQYFTFISGPLPDGDLVTEAQGRGFAGTDGVLAGDYICQNEADAAGLSGTYYAWLSGPASDNNAPADRFFQSTVDYVMPNSPTFTIVANNWTDLTNGGIDNNIQYTADGSVYTGNDKVWTNTNDDGTADGSNHCQDWTSGSSGDSGRRGDADNDDSNWTDNGSTNCNQSNRHIYCFQQPNIASQTTEIVPSGLIGHWRLDETTGTTTFDSSGSGNDLTYTSSSSSTIGIIDNARDFTGGYADGGNIPSLQITGDITLSAWVNSDSFDNGRSVVINAAPGETEAANALYSLTITDISDTEGDILLGHEYSTGNNQFITFDTNLKKNQWYHLATVRNDTAQTWTLYIDGQFFDVYNYTNSATGGTSGDLEIGRNAGNTAATHDGQIDDVRIYNRALEADEIMAVYQAKDGIRYNENQKTMEFFDGNRFVSMTSAWAEPNPAGDGGPSYQANGVNFDGSTHLADTTISGGDPTLITGSFWVRRDTGNLGVSQTILVYREASAGYFRIRFNSSNEFNIDGQQAGGGTFNILSGSSTTITDGNWHHIAFSIDSSNRSLDQIYIDDVDVTDAKSATYTAFGGGEEYFLASFTSGGSAEVYGDLADFWIDFDTKLDLSVEANRRLFRDSDGNAVDLGSDGSTPTGSQPELFFSGDASSWHTNKGSLGGATETGTITEASADPGVPPSNGLIAHWKLDETTGTTATDSAGTRDGTLLGSMDAGDDSVPGAVGTAMTFDGINDHFEYATNIAFDSNDFTVAAWAKVILPCGGAGSGNCTIFSQRTDISGTGEPTIRLHIDSTGIPEFVVRDDVNGTVISADSTAVAEGVWVHVVGVKTSSQIELFVNGSSVDTTAHTHTGDFDVGAVHRFIGRERFSSVNQSEMRGEIDDVRVYDRALSAAEITLLYQMGAPVGSSTALPAGCPTIGDVCDDGTIYAGDSPDGTIPMFTTPADQASLPWNNGNASNITTTSITAGNTGESNTLSLVLEDADSTGGFEPHQAAQACYDLVAHGADDWYLPAENELNLMYDELVDQNGDSTPGGPLGSVYNFDTSGVVYWSSTEWSAFSDRARVKRPSDGVNAGSFKNDSGQVRCVRKGPAPRCANPYGLEGQMIYNTTEDVVQYCDGARWVGIGEYATPPADTTNPTWVTASGTVATINTSSALSATVTATDANGVTYSKVSGDAWISVNSSTGELTGTSPGTAGTYSITVRASDPSSNTADRSFDVVVNAAALPSIALTGSGNINSGATSHTHSSVNFGAAATDRIIAVATSYRRTGSNTTTPITSMTIGGVSATQAIYTAASQRLQATIWYANVPTGTSGDVVINAAQSISSSISVYRIVDLTSSTPTATNGTGATGTTTTLGTTLTIQDDGVGICTAGNANDTATISWSGTQISVDTNIQNSSSRDNHHSAANITNTSGSSASRTYTSSWSGNEWSAQSCAAWR